MPRTQLVCVPLRVLQTDRRVRADLAETPLFQPMICHAAFRRTADLWLETMPRLRSRRAELRTALHSLREATPDKGGHKAKAVNLIEQAIGEVQAGIDFAARKFGD